MDSDEDSFPPAPPQAGPLPPAAGPDYDDDSSGDSDSDSDGDSDRDQAAGEARAARSNDLDVRLLRAATHAVKRLKDTMNQKTFSPLNTTARNMEAFLAGLEAIPVLEDEAPLKRALAARKALLHALPAVPDAGKFRMPAARDTLALVARLTLHEETHVLQALAAEWIRSIQTRNVANMKTNLISLVKQGLEAMDTSVLGGAATAPQVVFNAGHALGSSAVKMAVKQQLAAVNGRGADDDEPARNHTVQIDLKELTELCESLDGAYKRLLPRPGKPPLGAAAAADARTERRRLAFLRLFTVLQATIGCRPGDFCGSEIADLTRVVVCDPASAIADAGGGVYISANVAHSKGSFSERWKNGHARLYADLNCAARCPITAVAVALAEMDPELELNEQMRLMDAAHMSWRKKPLYADKGSSARVAKYWNSATADLTWPAWLRKNSSWNSLRKFVQTTVGARALYSNAQLFVSLRAGHADAKKIAGVDKSNAHYVAGSPDALRFVGLLCAHRHPRAPAGHPAVEMLLHLCPDLVERLVALNFPRNVREHFNEGQLRTFAAFLAVAGLDSDRGASARAALPALAALLRRPPARVPRYYETYEVNVADGYVDPIAYDYARRAVVRTQRVLIVQDTEVLFSMETTGPESLSEAGRAGPGRDIDAPRSTSDEQSDPESDETGGGAAAASDAGSGADSGAGSGADSDADSEPVEPTQEEPKPEPQTVWGRLLGLSEKQGLMEELRQLELVREALAIDRSLRGIEAKVHAAMMGWREPLLPGAVALCEWPEAALSAVRQDKHKRYGTATTASDNATTARGDVVFTKAHVSLLALHNKRRCVAKTVAAFESVAAAAAVAEELGITGINDFVKNAKQIAAKAPKHVSAENEAPNA